MTLPAIDLDACVSLLLELLAIPSPTGHTEAVLERVERELGDLGVSGRRTAKGGLVWTVAGASGEERGVAAHVDTLGAMVREIKESGRLGLSPIGGYDWATVEGAECLVHRRGGEPVSGTVVNSRQSVHVFDREAREAARRDPRRYEVRLDLPCGSKEEAEAAGVAVGDFVSFDSSARVTDNGFVKGRHLDDKAAVAVLLAVNRSLIRSKATLARTTHFYLSNYEEVGHGGSSGVPSGTAELLCIDMAAVGEGQASNEQAVSLCVKDAGGPYDPLMCGRLRELAREHGIDLRVDLYPNYRSDATAAWHAGSELRAALIGPGVDASHGYERTHLDALQATARLLTAWLLS